MNDEGVQQPKVGTEDYVPMSERFERDMDQDTTKARQDNIVFDEDSNIHFVYENMPDLLTTEEGQGTLRQMLRTFFGAQKERLDILEDYSKGENTSILQGKRRLEESKADKRIRHPFGGYISGFITGFIGGKPITVTTSQKESDDIEDLDRTHTVNDIDTLNYDLMYDASRYGRAFELHLRETGDNDDRIYLIDPQEMFVIRSADVTKRMIGAVHCPVYNGKVYLTIYTDTKRYEYEPFKGEAMKFVEKGVKEHFYDAVPVVEWWGNRYRTGDFEPVISIIDGYDSAQSDTSNYMTDLNDALLVVKGDIKGAGYNTRDFIEMKDANIMILNSAITASGNESPLDAGYIYKQYDVAGTEAYKGRLQEDIHTLSHVPNLRNESFGTASGIALQYKLIGLRQIQATKESYFKKALARRYKLIANIHSKLNDVQIESEYLDYTFHPNLPEDLWAEVKAFIDAGGEISQETLRALASFTDESTEKQRLLDEYQEDVARSLPARRIETEDTQAVDDTEVVDTDGE